MKKAINNWNWTGRPITWGIFKDLEPLLKDADKHPITPNHTRLMVEDYMLSEPGERLMCLVTKSFHLFHAPGKLAHIKDFKQSMQIQPWKPVRFQKDVFFAVPITVKLNAHLHDLRKESKSKTIDELRVMCSRVGGAGLTLSLPNNTTKLIKFDDVLNHCSNIQLWTTKPTKRMSIVKKSLRDIKDKARLGPIVEGYLDEVYGDRFVTSAYLHSYELLMSKALATTQIETYKKEPISTERLTRHLNLDQGDPTFITFKEYFDSVAKAAIMDVYSGFSAFTTPLLTQRVLAEVAEKFKQVLPQFYSTISLLLNKQVRTLNIIICMTCSHHFISSNSFKESRYRPFRCIRPITMGSSYPICLLYYYENKE
jgi:hypothetical protein